MPRFLAKMDRPLSETMQDWQSLPDEGIYQKTDMSRAIALCLWLEQHCPLDKISMLRAITIPFAEDEEDILAIWQQAMRNVQAGRPVLGRLSRITCHKPQVGHQKKAESGFYRHLKEFRLPSTEGYEVGQKLTVDMFELGDKISVSGTSKGRGFMGPMRRWNFRGMPASHGHEKVHRSTGSVGQCAWPAKIFKGKKMAGQMGNRKVTCGNLVIVDVIPEDNILLVKGQVPGPNEGVVILRKQA